MTSLLGFVNLIMCAVETVRAGETNAAGGAFFVAANIWFAANLVVAAIEGRRD